jgi:hypothetical protein
MRFREAMPPNSILSEAQREYTARLQEAEAQIESYRHTHITIGNIRLAIFISALAIAYLAFSRHQLSPWLLLVPLVAFVVLMRWHDAVLGKLRRVERKAHYYRLGLGRMTEQWKGVGSTGERFSTEAHPYAQDLDLFGNGSLFQLLSRARTEHGEELLAAWLCAPAAVETIRERHAAVDELRRNLDFREQIAIVGDDTIRKKEAAPLFTWGESVSLSVTFAMRVLTALLSLLMGIALLWFAVEDFNWIAGASPRPPLNAIRFLIVMSVVNGVVALLWRRRIAEAIADFEAIRPGLDLLPELLLTVEQASFQSAPLRRLQKEIGPDVRPSRQIKRLERLAAILDSREHLLLRVLGHPLLWTTQVTLAIEWWRKQYGRTTRAWVEALSETEALSSLATYAYEHGGDPFPEFLSDGPVFHGDQLGHPLIPHCVRNSVLLDTAQPLLIVSGSNMSGKSTFLRTIGINAVLAFAGAPVRAARLQLSVFQIGASLRIADSLQQGESHFSAEIKRIRMIVDQADKGPALFLIDEILHGTNSHDRLAGTEAILQQLLAKNAIGLITTHDLALTRFSSSFDRPAVNMHFQDHIQNGVMSFDYTVKPGVVQGSNALELMRLYGLVQ